jgi:hypothetical protein
MNVLGLKDGASSSVSGHARAHDELRDEADLFLGEQEGNASHPAGRDGVAREAVARTNSGTRARPKRVRLDAAGRLASRPDPTRCLTATAPARTVAADARRPPRRAHGRSGRLGRLAATLAGHQPHVAARGVSGGRRVGRRRAVRIHNGGRRSGQRPSSVGHAPSRQPRYAALVALEGANAVAVLRGPPWRLVRRVRVPVGPPRSFELVSSEIGGAVMALVVTPNGRILAGDIAAGSPRERRRWQEVASGRTSGGDGALRSTRPIRTRSPRAAPASCSRRTAGAGGGPCCRSRREPARSPGLRATRASATPSASTARSTARAIVGRAGSRSCRRRRWPSFPS